AESTVMDAQVDSETSSNQPAAEPTKPTPSKKPGKLPPREAKPVTGSSKDAASETLRKFFGGR
ncbi:MAG: hypothetical protein IT423_20400, partial [Pirellulaceae bacterium]|nr:hypothetical protein [Pirellulaceae bacterium]